MNLEKQRADALERAQKLTALVQEKGGDVTEAEIENLNAAVAEATRLDSALAATKSARATLDSLGDGGDDDRAPADETGFKAATTLGERFTKGAPYKDFQRKYPAGLSDAGSATIEPTKIATMTELLAAKSAPISSTTLAHLPKERRATVNLVAPPDLTILDVIAHGKMNGPFDYIQITAVTNNAAVVEEAVDDSKPLKPISGFTTALAECRSSTFADGLDVTNQLLSDAPAMASLLESQMVDNLHVKIADQVVNGAGTQGAPRGILHTTGVQELTYTAGADATRSMIEAVRKGKTKLRKAGARGAVVLVNPEDEEAIDLLQDKEGKYLGAGPWGLAPRTLWAMPRIESEHVEKGTILMGDMSQVMLMDHEGVSIDVFTQHKDYAQRNRAYVRAELRAGLVIWKPAHLLIVKKG
ncbi:MAG: phage major capsid protein [Buchananella hordeovulneris]|nr:phage major capsid protein [Buchananella hordeovulneris]